MANSKTTCRFWLRDDRMNQDGTAPVHLVYQIQGQRKHYSIPDIKLFPINWNKDTQQGVYLDKKTAKKIDPTIDFTALLTESEVQDINSQLDQVKADIRNIETRFKLDKTTFSPQMVIDALKGSKKPETKKDVAGTGVIEFINHFIKNSSNTHSAGTLKAYSGLVVHLTGFEKSKGIKFTFENIDTALLRNFHNYLFEEKTLETKTGKKQIRLMNSITAAKQLSTLKTLLNYARTIYKIPVKLDYRDFKISRKDSDLEVIVLTYDEFEAIYNLDLEENKSLDAVRDVFCFSCATGLRYSDLAQLGREHIRKDNTIRMTAAKTGQKLVIPLNPISYAILQKYRVRHKPLPIISNQKTNDYLKRIGELAGIDTPIEKKRMHGVKSVTKVFKKYELLSIHVGRKSFITLSLEKGAAVQDVMSLSGHTTFKAFKRYVDVNDQRKKSVMADAWGSVNPLKAAK